MLKTIRTYRRKLQNTQLLLLYSKTKRYPISTDNKSIFKELVTLTGL